MKKMTLLDEKQIFGSDRLDIIRDYVKSCAITDFAILLGGTGLGFYYINDGYVGRWWTKTSYDSAARVVNETGNRTWEYGNRRDVGARPALPYSSISALSSNGVRGSGKILEVEYGEYPQTLVDSKTQIKLEKIYMY